MARLRAWTSTDCTEDEGGKDKDKVGKGKVNGKGEGCVTTQGQGTEGF